MVKKFLQQLLFNSLYQRAHSRAFFTTIGIFLQEIKVVFFQFFSFRNPFSVIFICRQILISAIRLIAGRSARLSYSFTGEDRIIESILKPIVSECGFYVEVGCNDPIFISNTFSLYKRGWNGICIDANLEHIKKYKVFRPRDKAIHALVSDSFEKRNFNIYINDVLSSTEEVDLDPKIEPGFHLVKTEKMIPKTLTQIFKENNVPPFFDLLSIDVEEHDLNVIRSLDLTQYQPKLIVLESETIDPLDPKKNEIVNYLVSKTYIFQGSILKNLYFILPEF